MSPAIKVENLSKKYPIKHLGNVGDKGLADMALAAAKTLRRKALAPFQNEVGESGADNTYEEFWALRDASFELGHGERLGVIGPNGSGKSTLLKLMSRVTVPSAGKITFRGKIASILEVGTGFHPELTGRENIFLNGAVLGMKHSEILLKFDEIVDFSGVEKFLDTPVKRYSSGMFVRLAFAITAHLDSDILLLDEVLAVGDAEFQRKCLSKVDNLSSEGRTVLFVSHNLDAVKRLVNKCIRLDCGRIVDQGDPADVIEKYLGQTISNSGEIPFQENPTKEAQLTKAVIKSGQDGSTCSILPTDDIKMDVEITVRGNRHETYTLQVFIILADGTIIWHGNVRDGIAIPPSWEKGRHLVKVNFPGGILNDGSYMVVPMIFKGKKQYHNHYNPSNEYFVGGGRLEVRSEVFSGITNRRGGYISRPPLIEYGGRVPD